MPPVDTTRRPASAAPTLCALCATRPATTTDRIDRRTLPVCVPCKEGEVPPPARSQATDRRTRVLAALARFEDGADVQTLAEVLGEDDELGHGRLSALLNRARRDGLVEFTGRHNNRVYRVRVRVGR